MTIFHPEELSEAMLTETIEKAEARGYTHIVIGRHNILIGTTGTGTPIREFFEPYFHKIRTGDWPGGVAPSHLDRP